MLECRSALGALSALMAAAAPDELRMAGLKGPTMRGREAGWELTSPRVGALCCFVLLTSPIGAPACLCAAFVSFTQPFGAAMPLAPPSLRSPALLVPRERGLDFLSATNRIGAAKVVGSIHHGGHAVRRPPDRGSGQAGRVSAVRYPSAVPPTNRIGEQEDARSRPRRAAHGDGRGDRPSRFRWRIGLPADGGSFSRVAAARSGSQPRIGLTLQEIYEEDLM